MKFTHNSPQMPYFLALFLKSFTYSSSDRLKKKHWFQKLVSRPPQVDLVPARYIFCVNVPAKMCNNLDDLDILQIHL